MPTPPPSGPLCTRESLVGDLRGLGVRPGDTVLVHTSLRALGWVCGGPVAVVHALLDAVGPDGTLVVPAQSADNSDPSHWQNPPVPKEWWPAIRAAMPAYDPATTRTYGMGVVPETVRSWPGARRSAHPQTSFAALGRDASALTAGHALDCRLGERSPLARLEAAGAKVLLLGPGFAACTAFHLAEYRLPKPPLAENSFAVTTARGREWLTVRDVDIDDADFPALGAAYRAARPVSEGAVGAARARLFPLADAVAFAEDWLPRHRASSG